MDRNLRLFAGLLLIAAGTLFFLSCSDDGPSTAPCVNCDYWTKAFGRDGRYPAGCPTDPDLIAFIAPPLDTVDVMGGVGAGEIYYHIWVARKSDSTYHQITTDPTFDLKPVWSPDGTKIAFERGEAGGRDIFVVDVTDLENPGQPVQFTDNTVLEESNSSAAWVTVNGTEQWIAFSNSTNGGSDLDVVRKPYPGPGDAVWVTIDPSDFAEDQNGVLGFVFKDKHAGSNGSRYVAFSSPDRSPVGDIYVVARSEEESDTSVVYARVFINGKDSGMITPALFEYRPVQDTVTIAGSLDGYCSQAMLVFRDMQADTVNTTILDFVHTHGSLAATSIPGVLRVVVGEIVWDVLPDFHGEDSAYVDTVWVEQVGNTPPYDPGGEPQYRVYPCIPADTVLVYAASVYGPCSDTVGVVVDAGDTSYVQLICGGGSTVQSRPSWTSATRPPVLGQVPEPYSLWVVDVDTEDLYLIAEAETPISNPAVSPDGRFIAYVVGEGTTRDLVVSGDIQAFIAGTAAIQTTVIGLPGSAEDIECYRFPERVSWIYSEAETKVVASLSVCRGGDLMKDYEVWIGDLDRFID